MWQLSLSFRGLKGKASFEAYTEREDTVTGLLFYFIGK
jgi:hypothetical protein